MTMTGTNYPLSADDGPDDLPRTLRRAREEREQAQREAAAKTQGASQRKPAAPSISPDALAPITPDAHADRSSGVASSNSHANTNAYGETSVTHLDIPFGHLSMFFVKAVFAAIPALILLIAVLWGIGQVLEVLFPELIKMKIQIYFPH
ncbi:MAG: hypothetical protein ACRBCJ_00180 [Hyphomicrobiaceae bacterium]